MNLFFKNFILFFQTVANVDFYRYFLFLAWFPLTLLQLFLNCFAEIGDGSHINPIICPESRSSFLSRQFVCWFNSIVSLGSKKALEIDDLFRLEHDMEAGPLFRNWIKLWIPKSEEYAEKVKNARIKAAFSVDYDDDFLVSDSTPLLGDEKGIVTISKYKKKGYGSAETVNKPPKPAKIFQPKLDDIKQPSILEIFALMFKWPFIAATCVKFCSDLLQFANPLLLK